MAQQDLEKLGFIPDSSLSDLGFIPESGNAEGEGNNESLSSKLTSAANKFLFGNITDEDLIKHYSPEVQAELKTKGITPRVLGTPESEVSLLPSLKGLADRRAASGKSNSPYWEGFANSIYEDILRPFTTPSGILGSSSPRAAISNEVLNAKSIRIIPGEYQIKPTIKTNRLLSKGRPEPFIAGPGGVQRESLVTSNPQEEARLLGYNISENGPTGTDSQIANFGYDTDELREALRQRNLHYTTTEQAGGSRMPVSDRPNLESPAPSGSSQLGFNPGVSNANFPYPLNITPEALRPRSVQTVTHALAGDDFARSVAPSVEKITFESPKAKSVSATIKPLRDFKGGTAAITLDEPLLPSAKIKMREDFKNNTGLEVPDVANIKLPDNTPPEVASAIIEGTKNFIKDSAKPSAFLQSIYDQLKNLGPAGKELVFKFQRAAQSKAQYDAAWAEKLLEAGKRLKQNEYDNFGAYVEGRMPVPNSRVQNVIDEWNKIQNEMGDIAVNAGLREKLGSKIIPFRKISNHYWPRITAEENLNQSTIIDRLVKQGMSRYNAENIAKRWSENSEIFTGPQHARFESNFKYNDSFDSAIQHSRSMAKRIANHEQLGPKDVAGKGLEGIADLIESTSDKDLALRLAKRLAGRDVRPDEKLVKGLNKTRKLMALTSLQDFTFNNIILGNLTNAHMAITSGHPVAAAAEVTKLFKSSYRNELRASGAFNSFNKSLLEEVSGIDPFMLGAGEKINRAVAAAIGKSVIRSAFNDFKAGRNVKNARYFLETLLSRNPKEIAELTPELEKFAAGRMAEISQGLNNPGNLPYHWSDPVNDYSKLSQQLLLIFKKVGFQTTKTIKDSIKANPKVAIPTWLATSQIAGELVGDTKAFLSDNDRSDESLNRIANNWGNAFAFGMIYELAKSSAYGKGGLVSAVAGPVIGKASDFADSLYRTGKNLNNPDFEGDTYLPVKKFGVKNLPIPGKGRIVKSLGEER